jgi:hypothetical protein
MLPSTATNHQVVIDADTRLVVAVGRPVTGRNDCKACEIPGAKDVVGRITVIADGATAAPACSSRIVAKEMTAAVGRPALR